MASGKTLGSRIPDPIPVPAKLTPAVVVAVPTPVPTPTVQAQVQAGIAASLPSIIAAVKSAVPAPIPFPAPTICRFVAPPPPLALTDIVNAVVMALSPFFQKTTAPLPVPIPPPPGSFISVPVFNGFVVGVEQQPPDSFQKWIGRGINTMVTVPNINGTVDGKSWVTACQQLRLHYVIQANAIWDWSVIRNDPLCLAVMNGDEDNDDKITVVEFTTQVVTIRANISKPIFCNLDGTKEAFPDVRYEPAGYLSVSDITGFDKYSCNRGEGHDTIVPTIQTLAASHKTMSGGKPWWGYVECSNQNLATQGWPGPNARGPVPDEQNLIVDTMVANGASGIIYFPQQVAGGDYGFIWDAMMVDNVIAMTVKNATLCLRSK